MILRSLESFLGKTKQIPPNYSAVKIDGKKLYELARKNIEIPEVKPREIELLQITNFQILDINSLLRFFVTLEVSKGTYIRGIARDLGEMLTTGGTLEELRRTAVGNFKIEKAITLDDLNLGHFKLLNPFDFLDLPSFKATTYIEEMIANGRYLEPQLFEFKSDTVIYSQTGEPLAILLR